MPDTSKKRSSVGNNNAFDPPARRSRSSNNGPLNADFDDLDDVLVNILEFLPLHKIMCNRRVSRKWREMIKKVVPPVCGPPGDFRVNSIEGYHFMEAMTRALPNLQQITLSRLYQNNLRYGNWDKYSDGEDPDDEYAAETAYRTSHDIGIISNFSKLRILSIKDNMGEESLLNGSYPFLFNSFPLLQKLSIDHCDYLKWDLEMLAGFPLLKELNVSGINRLTGNIRSLRVLKDTLETLSTGSCGNIEGNLMDLADFSLLKELNLFGTAVTGDVRDIGENDFINLEKLRFPLGVVGGTGYGGGGYGYKFQRVADVPSVANAYYRLSKRAKPLSEDDYSYYSWRLSEESPDYYAAEGLVLPHCASFVKVGPRVGWRWTSRHTGHYDPVLSCEINWLDPEPDREDDDYEAYVEELTSIQEEITVYRGYHQPPTEEEYRRLCREYAIGMH